MMEAGIDYGVRVIRAYGPFAVGQVIYPTGVQREVLLAAKKVEAVEPPAETTRGRRPLPAQGRSAGVVRK